MEINEFLKEVPKDDNRLALTGKDIHRLVGEAHQEGYREGRASR